MQYCLLWLQYLHSVAIISPPLGVIADRRLVKMRWLKILTIVGAGGTFLIAIAPFLGNDLDLDNGNVPFCKYRS